MTDATIVPPPPIADPTPWEFLEVGEYAILELFGHTTLVGRIEEVERFGSKMLLLHPLFNGHVLGPVLHGGAAIYRLTPCTAEVAWKRQPKQGYQLPAPILAIVPPLMLTGPPDSEGERRTGMFDDDL